jgi:hypothetical protein
VIASAFTLILFGSVFILCAFVNKGEACILKTKFPVIAYAENKWLIMFLRTFGRRRPPTASKSTVTTTTSTKARGLRRSTLSMGHSHDYRRI